MNLSPKYAGSRAAARNRGAAAFTLPEALIAFTIFLLLLTGIIGANLFGLRWFQLSQSKLLATDAVRESMSKMTDEIRGSQSVYVGTVNTNGVFTGVTNGQAQIGTGLLVYSGTNTTNYVLYFRNQSDQTFRRICKSPGLTLTTIVSTMVTNTNIFQMQDYLGTVQSNSMNNRLVRCTLQFYQTAPNTPVPVSYTLDTAVSRRGL